VKRAIWPAFSSCWPRSFMSAQSTPADCRFFAPGPIPSAIITILGTDWPASPGRLRRIGAGSLGAARLRAIAAVAVIGCRTGALAARSHMENSITGRSEVNSHARGMDQRKLPSSFVLTTAPLRHFHHLRGRHWNFSSGRHPASRHPDMDNWPHWPAAVARPDLFLREEWACIRRRSCAVSHQPRFFARSKVHFTEDGLW